LREGWDTAVKVGVGMTPRGEVGLIVALLGLQMKMISDASYAIVVFMTGITTLFAPITLRYLYRNQPNEEQTSDYDREASVKSVGRGSIEM
jgi:Kef-type K+ transport system membrane component KefB